jgi:hypothetical protein
MHTNPEILYHSSDRWRFAHTTFSMDNYAFSLYAAANRSLDLTIEALEKCRVKEEVKRHGVLAKLV